MYALEMHLLQYFFCIIFVRLWLILSLRTARITESVLFYLRFRVLQKINYFSLTWFMVICIIDSFRWPNLWFWIRTFNEKKIHETVTITFGEKHSVIMINSTQKETCMCSYWLAFTSDTVLHHTNKVFIVECFAFFLYGAPQEIRIMQGLPWFCAPLY